MDCKHCGSQYTTIEHAKANEAETIITYACQACEKNFQIKEPKPTASGKWLMTFKEKNLKTGKCDSIFEIYRSDSGKTITVYSANHAQWSITETLPEMPYKVSYFGTKQSSLECNIWYKHWDNYYVTTIQLNEIEMNPELTKLALENEALKLLHKKDNLFIIDKPTDYNILTDARVWLSSNFAHQKQGCYIATAVYGSYDCPEVWTLRRYRDNTIAKTWYGRAFIRTYYAVSPTLVKWFGSAEWFKKMWQGKLDRIVKNLQDKGIESTPYEDKNW